MKLACVSSEFRHHEAEVAFAKIAAAGFKNVQLTSAHCDYNSMTNALIDNIAHELSRNGLRVVSYSPDNAQEHWTRMPRMFEVAKRVKAGCVVVPCANLSKAKQLEPLCEKFEIDLAMANQWPYPFGRPADFRSLNGAVGPRIGAGPDLGWFAAGGQDPLEIFDAVPNRIKAVQLKDVAAAGEHRLVDLGAGVARLEAFMAQLQAHGFSGPIVVAREFGRVVTFELGLFGEATYDVVERPVTDDEIMRGLRQAREWALAHGAEE